MLVWVSVQSMSGEANESTYLSQVYVFRWISCETSTMLGHLCWQWLLKRCALSLAT